MLTPVNLTKNQSLVVEVLSDAEKPLSAYDILDQLREQGFRAPLQVYRALEKLIAHGLVHRLESLNAFVACQHDEDHDQDGSLVFMICDGCGRTGEFSDAEIAGQLATRAKGDGFFIISTMVELRGLCAPCADAPSE